jgi:GntR family transcriptional regulator
MPAPPNPVTRPTQSTDGPRIPRYRSIAAVLGRRIDAQEFPPGSLLPSEADLATEFRVTRMTIRQALSGLAARGVIERRHGHGTVVSPIRLQREAQRPIGLAEELLTRGVVPTSRVLRFDEIRTPNDALETLWIGARGTVFRLRRLRYADGILIGLQETLIPAKHAPDLKSVDFAKEQSLTRVLRERHGLAATFADLTIEAVPADRPVAAALEITVGSPVLRSTRVSFLDDGRPLERTIGWFLGTRYSYRVRQGVGTDHS